MRIYYAPKGELFSEENSFEAKKSAPQFGTYSLHTIGNLVTPFGTSGAKWIQNECYYQSEPRTDFRHFVIYIN